MNLGVRSPRNMNYGVALTKVLPAQFAEDFLNGDLYLNTCMYFSQLDQTDVVRADPHDGVSVARQVAEIAIQEEKGDWIPIGGIQNPITFRHNDLLDLNIMCLYSMTDRPGDRFDERIYEFGDTAIFISNLPEFVHRVRKAAALSGWAIAHAMVEYVDPNVHDGAMGPLRKFQGYAYQNEFRFVFTTRERKPCRLNIGSLRDIAYARPSTEIPAIWASMRGADA